MPQHITHTTDVKKHDCVMVHQTLADRKTGEPYVWRWFGLVTTVTQGWLGVVRVNDADQSERRLYLNRHDCKVMLLEVTEWPDGLHVYTMTKALEGDLDIT